MGFTSTCGMSIIPIGIETETLLYKRNGIVFVVWPLLYKRNGIVFVVWPLLYKTEWDCLCGMAVAVQNGMRLSLWYGRCCTHGMRLSLWYGRCCTKRYPYPWQQPCTRRLPPPLGVPGPQPQPEPPEIPLPRPQVAQPPQVYVGEYNTGLRDAYLCCIDREQVFTSCGCVMSLLRAMALHRSGKRVYSCC
jgi:hypothetical protein